MEDLDNYEDEYTPRSTDLSHVFIYTDRSDATVGLRDPDKSTTVSTKSK